jgi:hypothetical protein
MRLWSAALVMVMALGLGGCRRREADEQREPAARKAGRAAYDLAKETREAARKAGHKLREASKEAREGWNEAKHDSKSNSEDKHNK